MKWTSGEPPEYFSDVVDDGFWVAEIDHEIVGTGKVNLQTGKVDAVFVHPQRVRFGIGAKIIKHLEHIAIDVGLIELNLESTLNAAPFYRSCGFQGIEIAKYNSPRGIELDCILMSKKLL
ncbi:GNAT family N-acetyltransferase [Solimicrobium silvestre]|nr:GNAT family N-acetyltransferase [Solimicrobium silvestre]